MQMKITIVYKLIISCLMGVANDALTTQNKYAVSFQFLKKGLSYGVDVLHADKHGSLLQVGSIFLMGLARHAQITLVNLQYFCDILRKKPEMKLRTSLPWLVQILLLQFIIHSRFFQSFPFPLSIWNPCQAFSLFDYLLV